PATPIQVEPRLSPNTEGQLCNVNPETETDNSAAGEMEGIGVATWGQSACSASSGCYCCGCCCSCHHCCICYHGSHLSQDTTGTSLTSSLSSTSLVHQTSCTSFERPTSSQHYRPLSLSSLDTHFAKVPIVRRLTDKRDSVLVTSVEQTSSTATTTITTTTTTLIPSECSEKKASSMLASAWSTQNALYGISAQTTHADPDHNGDNHDVQLLPCCYEPKDSQFRFDQCPLCGGPTVSALKPAFIAGPMSVSARRSSSCLTPSSSGQLRIRPADRGSATLPSHASSCLSPPRSGPLAEMDDTGGVADYETPEPADSGAVATGTTSSPYTQLSETYETASGHIAPCKSVAWQSNGARPASRVLKLNSCLRHLHPTSRQSHVQSPHPNFHTHHHAPHLCRMHHALLANSPSCPSYSHPSNTPAAQTVDHSFKNQIPPHPHCCCTLLVSKACLYPALHIPPRCILHTDQQQLSALPIQPTVPTDWVEEPGSDRVFSAQSSIKLSHASDTCSPVESPSSLVTTAIPMTTATTSAAVGCPSCLSFDASSSSCYCSSLSSQTAPSFSLPPTMPSSRSTTRPLSTTLPVPSLIDQRGEGVAPFFSCFSMPFTCVHNHTHHLHTIALPGDYNHCLANRRAMWATLGTLNNQSASAQEPLIRAHTSMRPGCACSLLTTGAFSASVGQKDRLECRSSPQPKTQTEALRRQAFPSNALTTKLSNSHPSPLTASANVRRSLTVSGWPCEQFATVPHADRLRDRVFFSGLTEQKHLQLTELRQEVANLLQKK
ncbi:unnamed protein product, partial [Protopolystoma xenopodis]